jgi:hypothetical protein
VQYERKEKIMVNLIWEDLGMDMCGVAYIYTRRARINNGWLIRTYREQYDNINGCYMPIDVETIFISDVDQKLLKGNLP